MIQLKQKAIIILFLLAIASLTLLSAVVHLLTESCWFEEEAVKRQFCLSCVAQSVLQQASCRGGKSERFNLTSDNETTYSHLYRRSLIEHYQMLQKISPWQCLVFTVR